MAKVGKVVRATILRSAPWRQRCLTPWPSGAGLPLSELLGGRFHDRLPVAWTLQAVIRRQDIAEAEEMLDRRRHKIFKLKIGYGDEKRILRT